MKPAPQGWVILTRKLLGDFQPQNDNDETKSPWLLGPDGAGVIGYDDPESIALKTAWAMKNGLRGVFFWEVNGDRLSDGSNPLQESSRQKFNEALKNKN